MKAALYRLSEFLEIKKRLLDIRENARGAIKTTDKDIAKTALIAKGFREAGQTACIITDNFILFPLDGGDYILHPVIGVSTQFFLKDVILNIQ